MRTLKKTLSLVLALVLCLGLVGTAFATSYDKYTDAAEVGAAYKEAVDVLKGVGIIDGVSATELNPTGTYTREQAAKIVAYLKLGKTAADKLSAAKAPFEDVAADRWSAGYINYCVDAGIIKGYGDGNFGPADALTGYAFGAMLLRAVGYGVNGEYDGTGYSIKVAQDAIPLHVYDGDLSAAVNDPIQRQQAILMAFNTMTKVSIVKWSTLIGDYVIASGTAAGGSAVESGKLQANFRLEKRIVNNDNGFKCHEWYNTLTGKAIADVELYNDQKVLGTSVKGTSIANLTTKGKPTYVAELAAAYELYYNGVYAKPVANTGDAVAAGDTVLNGGKVYLVTVGNADFTSATATELYDTASIGRGDIVTLLDSAVYDGKVDRIAIEHRSVATLYSAPVVDAATETVKIADIFGSSSVSVDYVKGYENLAKNDVVMYVNLNGTTYIEKCAVVEGVISKYTAASAVAPATYTIGEKAYSESQAAYATGVGAYDYKTSKTYYLDNAGYIVKSAGTPALAATNYGLFLAEEYDAGSEILGKTAYSKVQIFTANGEKVVYDVVDTVTGRPFSIDSVYTAGELISYKLTAAGAVDKDSITKATPTAQNTQVKITNKASSVDGITGDYVNSNTLFFFYEAGTPAKMNVIKGYANVNTTTIAAQAGVSGAAYFMAPNATLPAMVAYSPVGTTASYVYITSTAYSAGLLADGKTAYVEYKTADGTIKMTSTLDSGSNAYAVGAYSIDTNPATGLSVGTPVSAHNKQAELGDATYFVTDSGTYTIAPTTKVFEVTYNTLGQVVAVEAATMRVNSATEWITVLQMNQSAGIASVVYFTAKPATAYAAAPAMKVATNPGITTGVRDLAKTDLTQDLGATELYLKVTPVAGTTVVVEDDGTPVAAVGGVYTITSGTVTVTVSRTNATNLVYTFTVA